MKRAQFWQTMRYELFLIPALCFYTTFTIFPLLKTFFYSFTNFDGVTRHLKYVGFKNYLWVFRDQAMISSLSYTLFFTICTVTVVTMLAIPLALIFDANFKTKNIHKAIFFFPSIPSGLLLGYIWGFILSPASTGAVNFFLTSILKIKPVFWLSDPLLAQISSIIVAVWAGSGWHAMLYLAYLQSIPADIYEAAAIDGAGGWQRIRYITLPMLAPAMTISVMFLITGGLKVYEIPFALTQGGPGFSLYTITQVILLRGISELNYGRATAISIIFFLIVLLFTFFQVNVMQKREEKMR